MELIQKILEYNVNCPICGREFKVEEHLYNMPLVGKVIISSGRCSNCGYKWSDVRLAESKGPRKIAYTVEKPGDENAILIKSSTSAIVIPELGVEIYPGPAAVGYITTIEGLIIDIIEKTEFLCSEPDAPEKECKEKLELLKKARDGEIKYIVMLLDPEGVSAIISDKATIMPLEKDEIKKIEERLGLLEENLGNE